MELMQVQSPSGSVYDSDEFRLFCHKILPCSKRTPHDWASCPFAHPGEKAKRRNIRTHWYDCEMCPSVVKGEECTLGANCPHSHNVFESWLHPQKYRTMMCKDRDKCARAVCFFAHGPHQLRTPTDIGPQPLQPLPGITNASSSSEATLVAMTVDATQTAAAAAPGPVAGVGLGASSWYLMQDMAQLARATSNSSVVSSTGPSTPTAKPGSTQSPAVAAAAGGAGMLPEGSSPQASSVAAMSGGNTYAQQLQQQQPGSYGSKLMEMIAAEQAKLASGDMSSMRQLLSSLVQEVNASRQEAERSRTEAAQAQQQLQAFSAAFGGLPAGPGVSAGMPMSPPAVAGAAAGGASGSSNLQLSANRAAVLQGGGASMPMQQQVLMQQQQQGSYMNMDCSEASSCSFIELPASDAANGSNAGSACQLHLVSVAGMDQMAQVYGAAGMPGQQQQQQQLMQVQGNSGPLPQLMFGGPLQRSPSDSTGSGSAAGPSRFQLQSGQGINNVFNSSNQYQYVGMANPAVGSSGLAHGMNILSSSPVSQGQPQGGATTLVAAAAPGTGGGGGVMQQLPVDCIASACQPPPPHHQQQMLLGSMMGVPGVVVSAAAAPMYFI